MQLPDVLGLDSVRKLYATGGWTPHHLIKAVRDRIDTADPAIFISRTPTELLMAAVDALIARAPKPNSLPLWGVPFAVKDNIDVAGLPTTCACPAFTHIAGKNATVVEQLIAAGAIVVGKTNLDQFATGLNGTRSPYGIPRSVFDPDYISGGSSSGSAVAVAMGLASFSLGTDTAGSGRVPAAFNNIVGIKPTPGLLSTSGLVPACESLDCISVFSLSVQDGAVVRRLAEGFDATDPWSRKAQPHDLPVDGPRVGILKHGDQHYFGKEDNALLYDQAIARLGGEPVEIDYEPFLAAARLLYEGAWVAERQAAFESLSLPQSALEPSVAAVFANARAHSAVNAFDDFHKLAALKRRCDVEWEKMDILLLPTAPRSFTVDEMLAEPIARNSMLGTYTNFCNLLGLSAIAVPAGFDAAGFPFGVTLVAPEFSDDVLLPLADRLHRAANSGAGIDLAYELPALTPAPNHKERFQLAVVGAHLSGMPLNHELVSLGGQLVERTRTAPGYRLFVLPDSVPAKPGLLRAPDMEGPGIEVEIWSLDAAAFGSFVAGINTPLGIGKIMLADGKQVSGFLCEAWAIADAEEITSFGSWREYRSVTST